MPESFISSLDDVCSALESFVGNTGTAQWNGITRAPSSMRHGYGRSQSAIADANRLNAAIYTPKEQAADPPSPTTDNDAHPTTHRGKRARGEKSRKGSSEHYGVRFRPDLRKWVAEIRVAEWKDVDKKVWLGTFDTEVGAARGVDLARKLLRCAKRRPPNLPCRELELYSARIPPHLDLTDLANDAMFKAVVAFIKAESRAYAARFPPPAPPPTPPNPNPNPNPLPELTLHNGTDQAELSDFDMADLIFQEAFQFDSSSPGSSAPSSFTAQDQFPFQVQVEQNEIARGASLWAMEMELDAEPVCQNLEAAVFLPPTWPGEADPSSGGAYALPLNTGLQSEQDPLYISPDDGGGIFDITSHWTLQSEEYQFQMDLH